MIYKEYPDKVTTVADLVNISLNFKDWVFRGQRKRSWDLLPKIGRFKNRESKSKSTIQKRLTDEESLISSLLIRLPSFGYELEKGHKDDSYRYYSSWNTMIIGQHHGLETRLLDFTKNILVACYFALRSEEKKEDSSIFCINPLPYKLLFNYKITPQHEIYSFNPFSTRKSNFFFYPKQIDDRIRSQGSIFMYFKNPFKPLIPNESIIEIIIPNLFRKLILIELSEFGVCEETLFPDLDGISNYLNWHHLEKEFY